MWGGAKTSLTTDEINVINSSPLLVSELNDYQNAVDRGKAQPILSLLDLKHFNTLQTENTGSGLQIQFGGGITSAPTETFVGDLSYELAAVQRRYATPKPC